MNIDLENIYKNNEDNMPLFSTILVIRKILLLKKIFEIAPNITLNYNTNVYTDSQIEFLDFELKKRNIPSLNINKDLNSLLESLDKTDKQFKNYILRESNNILNEEESYKFLLSNARNFTYSDSPIINENLNNFITESISNIVKDCKQEENFSKFVKSILNNENYNPEIISLYDLKIPIIPVTLEDTYNHKYQEWGLHKDEFVGNQIIKAIKNNFEYILNSKVLNNIEEAYIFIEFNNNTFNLKITENNLNTVIYEQEYISKIAKFDYLGINNHVQRINDKLKIIDYDSLDFILEHSSTVLPHMFDTKKLLTEIHSYNEKILISHELQANENISKINKRL